MVSKDSFVADTLKRLDKIEVGKALDIRTYKKDRKIVILKLEGAYHVYEDGFEKESYLNVQQGELKKLLKKLGRIEFPRSNKLWVSTIDKVD